MPPVRFSVIGTMLTPSSTNEPQPTMPPVSALLPQLCAIDWLPLWLEHPPHPMLHHRLFMVQYIWMYLCVCTKWKMNDERWRDLQHIQRIDRILLLIIIEIIVCISTFSSHGFYITDISCALLLLPLLLPKSKRRTCTTNIIYISYIAGLFTASH